MLYLTVRKRRTYQRYGVQEAQMCHKISTLNSKDILWSKFGYMSSRIVLSMSRHQNMRARTKKQSFISIFLQIVSDVVLIIKTDKFQLKINIPKPHGHFQFL